MLSYIQSYTVENNDVSNVYDDISSLGKPYTVLINDDTLLYNSFDNMNENACVLIQNNSFASVLTNAGVHLAPSDASNGYYMYNIKDIINYIPTNYDSNGNPYFAQICYNVFYDFRFCESVTKIPNTFFIHTKDEPAYTYETIILPKYISEITNEPFTPTLSFDTDKYKLALPKKIYLTNDVNHIPNVTYGLSGLEQSVNYINEINDVYFDYNGTLTFYVFPDVYEKMKNIDVWKDVIDNKYDYIKIDKYNSIKEVVGY